MFFKKDIASLSDEDLITKYKESEDNVYIGELYKKYTHVVLGVCMKYLRDREEAKDSVMQIFEKLMSDLKKHEVVNFRGWLHMVAKNHCLMKLRNKTQMVDIDQVTERSDNVVEFNHDLHPIDESEMQLTNLEEAISCLDDDQKKCVELFYLKERSYKDVADATGFTLNQVKSYIQNGKRNLKNYLVAKNVDASKKHIL
ncbi:MAG TPA: sigma-70 family RNA polymerase sigma factor [Cytophagaceae bacterium]|jgi:RNA polymerase sigma factor (sigma-70 family)|nr:sigma-70 family RNA polymerase sigma factor [Cytophagaceae bacterium]